MKEFELELRPERQDDSHDVLSENLLGPPLGIRLHLSIVSDEEFMRMIVWRM